MLCAYCGGNAAFTLKNGKPCCSKFSSTCPEVRRKNTEGLIRAHTEGKMRHDQLDHTRNWNKGKTVYSDKRIKSGISHEQIFCVDSKVTTATVKKILIFEGLCEYRCAECQNPGEWLGKVIVLELDHINGNNKDNRLENIQFLCPNCHSQTPTFRNKNRRECGRENVSEERLLDALRSKPSILSALTSLGLAGAGNYARAYRLITKFSLSMPIRQPAIANLPKPRSSKTRNCPVCQKEILTKRKYCSHTCSNTKNQKIAWDNYDLAALYEEHGSFLALVRFFGGKVTDNAIRKQMRKRNIKWR